MTDCLLMQLLLAPRWKRAQEDAAFISLTISTLLIEYGLDVAASPFGGESTITLYAADAECGVETLVSQRHGRAFAQAVQASEAAIARVAGARLPAQQAALEQLLAQARQEAIAFGAQAVRRLASGPSLLLRPLFSVILLGAWLEGSVPEAAAALEACISAGIAVEILCLAQEDNLSLGRDPLASGTATATAGDGGLLDSGAGLASIRRAGAALHRQLARGLSPSVLPNWAAAAARSSNALARFGTTYRAQGPDPLEGLLRARQPPLPPLQVTLTPVSSVGVLVQSRAWGALHGRAISSALCVRSQGTIGGAVGDLGEGGCTFAGAAFPPRGTVAALRLSATTQGPQTRSSSSSGEAPPSAQLEAVARLRLSGVSLGALQGCSWDAEEEQEGGAGGAYPSAVVPGPLGASSSSSSSSSGTSSDGAASGSLLDASLRNLLAAGEGLLLREGGTAGQEVPPQPPGSLPTPRRWLLLMPEGDGMAEAEEGRGGSGVAGGGSSALAPGPAAVARLSARLYVLHTRETIPARAIGVGERRGGDSGPQTQLQQKSQQPRGSSPASSEAPAPTLGDGLWAALRSLPLRSHYSPLVESDGSRDWMLGRAVPTALSAGAAAPGGLPGGTSQSFSTAQAQEEAEAELAAILGDVGGPGGGAAGGGLGRGGLGRGVGGHNPSSGANKSSISGGESGGKRADGAPGSGAASAPAASAAVNAPSQRQKQQQLGAQPVGRSGRPGPEGPPSGLRPTLGSSAPAVSSSVLYDIGDDDDDEDELSEEEAGAGSGGLFSGPPGRRGQGPSVNTQLGAAVAAALIPSAAPSSAAHTRGGGASRRPPTAAAATQHGRGNMIAAPPTRSSVTSALRLGGSTVAAGAAASGAAAPQQVKRLVRFASAPSPSNSGSSSGESVSFSSSDSEEKGEAEEGGPGRRRIAGPPPPLRRGPDVASRAGAAPKGGAASTAAAGASLPQTNGPASGLLPQKRPEPGWRLPAAQLLAQAPSASVSALSAASALPVSAASALPVSAASALPVSAASALPVSAASALPAAAGGAAAGEEEDDDDTVVLVHRRRGAQQQAQQHRRGSYGAPAATTPSDKRHRGDGGTGTWGSGGPGGGSGSPQRALPPGPLPPQQQQQGSGALGQQGSGALGQLTAADVELLAGLEEIVEEEEAGEGASINTNQGAFLQPQRGPLDNQGDAAAGPAATRAEIGTPSIAASAAVGSSRSSPRNSLTAAASDKARTAAAATTAGPFRPMLPLLPLKPALRTAAKAPPESPVPYGSESPVAWDRSGGGIASASTPSRGAAAASFELEDGSLLTTLQSLHSIDLDSLLQMQMGEEGEGAGGAEVLDPLPEQAAGAPPPPPPPQQQQQRAVNWQDTRTAEMAGAGVAGKPAGAAAPHNSRPPSFNLKRGGGEGGGGAAVTSKGSVLLGTSSSGPREIRIVPARAAEGEAALAAGGKRGRGRWWELSDEE